MGSSVVFVDGGNSFNSYLVADVADVARGFGMDPRAVLERIYVSRAFTAYQFSALILERLEPFLDVNRSGLIMVSDVSFLFLDRDIPKTEAKDLFVKVCAKLSDIADMKGLIVLATYRSDKGTRLGLFLESVLFGRSKVSVSLRGVGKF